MLRNTRSMILGMVVVFLLTLFPMLFLLRPTVVKAASGTVIEVEPHANFARVGETFSINIIVADVQNLYGVEVTLYWNASIMEMVNANVMLGVESHRDGILHEPVSTYQNQTFQERGKYVLAGSSTAPAPSFNGSGAVARVTFRITDIGSCKLSLETKLASNIIPEGSISVAPIPHTTIDGFFGPIQTNAAPTTITAGENINISGLIAPAQANVAVTILYKGDEETAWHTIGDITTDAQGNYLYIWKPEKSGKYYVKSIAIVLGNEQASSPILINVNEPEQPEWLFIGILISALVALAVIFIVYARRTRRKQRINLKRSQSVGLRKTVEGLQDRSVSS